MKIVVNYCFGGFGVSKEAKELYGLSDNVSRTDERLIRAIEERGSKFVSGKYASLYIENIPDEATDYTIFEYDGSETLFYVIDGKIEYVI